MKLLIDINSVAMPHFFKQDKQADEARGAFTATLLNLLETYDIKPEEILAVYDHETSRQGRQSIYPPYKTHRKSTLEPEERNELNNFLNIVKEDLKSIGSIVATHPHIEADDLLVYFANVFPDAIIWSGDKDVFQVDNLIHYQNKLWSPDECPQDIPRKYIPLLHAIIGDTKDYGKEICNNGLGIAFFKKLYKTFGDYGLEQLESLIQNREIKRLEEDLDAMPELKKLIKDERNVYLRYKLSRPLPVKLYRIKWEASVINPDNFLLKTSFGVKEILATPENYDMLYDEIRDYIDNGYPVVFDFETYHCKEALEWLAKQDKTKVDPLGSIITGIGVECGRISAYFPFEHKGEGNLPKDFMYDLLATINNSKGPKVAHNAVGFEIPVAKENVDIWLQNIHDTMLMASYVDENDSKGLKYLAEKYLKYKQVSYEETTKGLQMNELEASQVVSYGLDDVHTTRGLYNLFKTILKVERSWEAFKSVEVDAALTTAMGYVRGFGFDSEKMQELLKEDLADLDIVNQKLIKYLVKKGHPSVNFEPIRDLSVREIKRAVSIFTGKNSTFRVRKLDKIIDAIKDQVSEEFIEALEKEDINLLNDVVMEKYDAEPIDVRSNKVMTEILYDFLGYPVRFRSKLTATMRKQGRTVGNPTADNFAIEHMIAFDAKTDEDKEFLKNILKAREILTRKSLYYDQYPNFIHWKDGRIHSNLGQSKTTTRRFAPSKPNLNQLPKKKGKFRECFVASPGYTLVIFDYEGQELKGIAHFSGDKNLIEGLTTKDVHSLTAVSIDGLLDNKFENDYSKFMEALNNKDEYAVKLRKQFAKSTNFGLAYGGSSYTLAKQMTVDEKLTEKFVKAYETAYPGIIEWQQRTRKEILKNKAVREIKGGVRHLHKYFYNGEISDHWIRSGINYQIQGSCASQVKTVMGKVIPILYNHNAHFLVPVHDELVCEVPDENVDAFISDLIPIATAPWWREPLEASIEIKTGKNYGKLAEYSK